MIQIGDKLPEKSGVNQDGRSEERRVGKEWRLEGRSRCAPYPSNKQCGNSL